MNKRIKKRFSAWVATLTFVMLVVAVGEAVAASGGKPPSIADTFNYWSNFIVFVAVLGYVLKKPLGAFWVQRVKDIASAVNAGKEAEKAALQRLEVARTQHASIDDEVKKMLVRIEEEGEAEAKRIVADAKERAKAIQARAEEGLSAEQGNLEVRLREQLADDVLAKAEEIIRAKLNSDVDRKLRESVVGGVGNLVQ